MKAVAILLFAMVATSQAGLTYLGAAPYSHLIYAAPVPVTYTASIAYSAPKVHNVEVETPVITKANLNVVTDADKISTTEIKPFGGLTFSGYPYIY